MSRAWTRKGTRAGTEKAAPGTGGLPPAQPLHAFLLALPVFEQL